VHAEICIAVNLIWILCGGALALCNELEINLGTWCNWLDSPVFRGIDPEVCETGGVYGSVISDRSRSAILVDTCARIEARAEHFLLSFVA